MRSSATALTFTLALILSFIQLVFSQDKITVGSGGFHIGSKFYNTQSYSFFLQDGKADLNNNLISVGGGGYAIFENFMLGGRGFYQGGESRDVTIQFPFGSSRDYTYSLYGGGGYLNLGHVVYNSKEVLLFPQLGIGCEALVLEKALNEPASFDPREALPVEYRWTSPMLDFSAGIDWFPFEKNGAKVGLRLGYTISLQRNSDWSHTGGEFITQVYPKITRMAFIQILPKVAVDFLPKNDPTSTTPKERLLKV